MTVVKKVLKALLIVLLALVVITGIVYFRAINYKTYSLKPDVEKFEPVSSQEDVEKLVDNLVSQMTLKEKIDQMYGEKMFASMPKFLINILLQRRFPHVYVGRNERLNIPPWVLSDGPRGARVMAQEVEAVTTFPVAMARGASWDVELEKKVHDVIAMEMRANGTNYAATPCVNVLRHPAWGRAQETYGEDPWLLGEFGVAAVKALQAHNVMACPKHFVLNSIENSRWVVNVEVDERTLREVYLPHWKKMVQDANTASLMTAYNAVRGAFCGSNKELLTDILREEWGFDGFVSTDWGYGLYDGIKGVQAGLDVEMPWQNQYSYDTIKEGIEAGDISERNIDEIVTRILNTRLRYAFAEDKMEYVKELIARPAHRELAREVAENSMVLLKNNGVLPFEKSGNKKIAVIGRLADVPNTGDQGSSDATPPYVITPYAGIKAMHESLGNEVLLHDGADLTAAKELAGEADEVILVVGFTHEDEGEYIILSRDKMMESAKAKKLIGEKGMGGDRESLKLLPDDEKLIKALAGVNKNLVVTYVGGSAIDMSDWKEEVPAILFAWYAGMEGGHALANILYGEVNPSGKLPFSIAENEEDYPYFNPYIEEITYGYYHGYTLFDKKGITPAYPFGYGLSYTDYQYSSLAVKTPQLAANDADTLQVSVDIENVGNRRGREIAQLYIGFRNSKIDRPVKLLKGFQKIHLAPNERKTVHFSVPVQELSWYNPETGQWEIEAMEYEVLIGKSSSETDLLKDSLVITEVED